MKFKNIKKKTFSKGGLDGKKAQFPSNSRTINELFKFSFPKLSSAVLLKIYRRSLKIFIIFIFLCTAIIVGIDLQKNIKAKQSIDLEKEKLTKNLMFWESFISEHKDYRDAYFQASILEYKLGDSSKAKIYADKGLELDPNSEEGKKIEKFLNNK